MPFPPSSYERDQDDAAARAAMRTLSRRCSTLQSTPKMVAEPSATRNGGKRRSPRSRSMITETIGWVGSALAFGGVWPNGVFTTLAFSTWTIAKCGGCDHGMFLSNHDLVRPPLSNALR